MKDLEFRKFLTTYGISYEEYDQMESEEKEKIIKKFKTETKTNAFQDIGKGMQGCGCLVMMIPILAILLVVLFSLVKSLF